MFAELLAENLAGILTLTPEQLELLEKHYILLHKWNRILNLTSIRDLAQVVERHYAESLFLASRLSPESIHIADVGSGAGFPGIPVAIFRPDCEVVLIESHQRKAAFLREATRGFPNTRVLAARAESIGERFDLVVSRAVSYRDLMPFIGKLGDSVALLTGAEQPPKIWKIEWQPAVSLPWGQQRFLRIGVSRETSPEVRST